MFQILNDFIAAQRPLSASSLALLIVTLCRVILNTAPPPRFLFFPVSPVCLRGFSSEGGAGVSNLNEEGDFCFASSRGFIAGVGSPLAIGEFIRSKKFR